MEINFKNIYFKYNEKNLFDNFNLKIKKNDLVYMIGLNNSGKSTILKLLKNYPCDGEILFDNVELNSKNSNKIYEKCIFIDEDNLIDLQMQEVINNNYYIAEDFEKLNINNSKDFIDKIKLNIYFALTNSKIEFVVIDDIIDYLNSKDKTIVYELIKKYYKLHKKTIWVFSNNADGLIYFKRILVLSNGIIKFDGTIKKINELEKIFDELDIKMPFIVDLSIKLKLYNLVEKTYVDSLKLVNDIWKEKQK